MSAWPVINGSPHNIHMSITLLLLLLYITAITAHFHVPTIIVSIGNERPAKAFFFFNFFDMIKNIYNLYRLYSITTPFIMTYW